MKGKKKKKKERRKKKQQEIHSLIRSEARTELRSSLDPECGTDTLNNEQ